jgi:predicted nucleic acid-binding protein
VTIPTASESIVIDSSGWLEYITADTKADNFAPFFGDQSRIVVPVLVLYEVRRVLLQRYTKTLADNFVSDALLLRLVPVDEKIALSAAMLGIEYQLSVADAIIYATCQREKASLVTSDSHFKELPGVTLL